MSPKTRSRAWINRWVFDTARRKSTLWERLSAPQLFIASFVLLIALGTLGLATLPFLYVNGSRLGLTDAALTATSAVCITGLTVVDTATRFTWFGQAFILLLIPVGVFVFAWPVWLLAILLFVDLVLLFFVSMTSVFLLRVFFADRRRGRGRQTGVAKQPPRVITTEPEPEEDGDG